MAVFSQYGEVVDVNLVRAEDTGKSRGFAFICYEDQRSTVLAVDNLNGAKVVGRIIKVDHVEDYKLKDEEAAKRKDWKCGCGGENFKFRDNCFKCGGPRPLQEGEEADFPDEKEERGEAARDADGADGRRRHDEGFKHDQRVAEDERPAVEEGYAAARKAEAWEGAAFNAISQTSEEDEMIKALKARKEAALARAKAAAAGLPIPGGDDALEQAKREAKEAKRARKEAKKEKKEKKPKKEKKTKKDDRDFEDDGLGVSSSEEEGAVPPPTRAAERDGNCGGGGGGAKGGQRRRSRSRSRERYDHRSGRGGRDRSRDRYDDRSGRGGRDRSRDRYEDHGGDRRDRR